jgi:deoxyribonuclease IV
LFVWFVWFVVNLFQGAAMSELPFRFGTVGSPNSTPKKPGGSVGAIQHIRSLGLDALELGWVQSVRVTPATCAAIRQTALDQNVAVSVHASYFINLNANDDEWPRSRQRLMDAAYYGNLAGATDIIFHPGSYFERPPAEVLAVAIPRLQGCLAELRAAGNPVCLRPETMGKSAMLGSLEDTLAMSAAVADLGGGIVPCLDFAHLHARAGDGTVNSYAEWLAIIDAYAQTLGADALHHLHIHLSGIAYSPKGERNHLPIAESDIDLSGLFRALKERGCGGRILCESPIMEEDALAMQKFLATGIWTPPVTTPSASPEAPESE